MSQKKKKKMDYHKLALDLWFKIVKLRDGFKCIICGDTYRVAGHHLISKERNRPFKLITMNGVCLCSSCHRWGFVSAHGHPEEMLRFFIMLSEKRPDQYQWMVDRLWKHEEKNFYETPKQSYLRLLLEYENLKKTLENEETNEQTTGLIK